MKLYHKLLFLTCILFWSSFASGQESLNIDYSIIKENMTKDSLTYIRLKNRYERNDTTLSFPEYAIIYYGYSFTPEYSGSDDQHKKELERLIDNQKYQEAYRMGKSILEKNPVALYALYNMYYLAQALERPIEETNSYIIKYSKLLHTIALSGDGKSESTAFKIIAVDDEYQLLYNYWGVDQITLQSRVNRYDVIEFNKSQHYNGKMIYFDISRTLREN